MALGRRPRIHSQAESADEYLSELSDDRREALGAVRRVILANLPDGYEEVMEYGMIAYVVPLTVLKDTYNGRPLMYSALASQKRHMSLYLTNVYGDQATEQWFRRRYAESGKRLDMGKSCVRFKKLDDLPLDLVGEVIARTSLAEVIDIYRASRQGLRSRKR